MSKKLQHFLPDIDPTIAVSQAGRFEPVSDWRPAQARQSTPIFALSVIVLLVIASWTAGSPEKKTVVSASIEISAPAGTLASR